MEKLTQETIQEALTPTENHRVRHRAQKWFWIDNEILDNYGHLIGPYGLSVYMALARFTNNESQETFVSQSTIARLTGMSTKEVTRTYKTLESFGLISLEKRLGQTSIVTLEEPSKKSASESQSPPRDSQSQGVGLTVPGGRTHSPTNKPIPTRLTEQQLNFFKKVDGWKEKATPPPKNFWRNLKSETLPRFIGEG